MNKRKDKGKFGFDTEIEDGKWREVNFLGNIWK